MVQTITTSKSIKSQILHTLPNYVKWIYFIQLYLQCKSLYHLYSSLVNITISVLGYVKAPAIARSWYIAFTTTPDGESLVEVINLLRNHLQLNLHSVNCISPSLFLLLNKTNVYCCFRKSIFVNKIRFLIRLDTYRVVFVTFFTGI